MKRTILTITLILIACSAASAQKQNKKDFIISSAFYFGGVSADILSSRGRIERNILLRDGTGKINVPRTIAISAIPYGISLWLDHKHHSKAATLLRFFGGDVHITAAVINWRTKIALSFSYLSV